MFSDYVLEGALYWQELEDDIFNELYCEREIGDYRRGTDPESDYYNAWEYWSNSDIFWEWLTDRVKEYGFFDYDKEPQDGTFMWIHAEEMLVVKPNNGPVELPAKVIATFDRDSLYETEYAEGIVRDGVFYATIIARELD